MMSKNKYSLSELVSTLWALILTKIFFSQARLLRRPIYIRGRRSIVGGKKLTTGHACRFDLTGERKTLFIGERCEFGDNVHIVAYENVKIGDDVLMASKIFISDTSHGEYKGKRQDSPDKPPRERVLGTKPVEIGDRVWLGENVVVLAGSRIGNGCIIGANSVVCGNIPDKTIAVGAPARPIKKWNELKNEWEYIGKKD